MLCRGSGGCGEGGLAVGVDIFHERDDIMLPIRLPLEQGCASFSSFHISAGIRIFSAVWPPWPA